MTCFSTWVCRSASEAALPSPPAGCAPVSFANHEPIDACMFGFAEVPESAGRASAIFLPSVSVRGGKGLHRGHECAGFLTTLSAKSLIGALAGQVEPVERRSADTCGSRSLSAAIPLESQDAHSAESYRDSRQSNGQALPTEGIWQYSQNPV